MNFQTMEYFVVLAHELNFTRAAEKLHITQQSLSSHIASVERELGCQLLERKNPLQLTFAGRTFLRYAVQYENSMQSMRQEFADIRGEEKGLHTTGQAVDLGGNIAPAKLHQIAQQVQAEMIPGRGGLGLYSWGVHIDNGKYSRWNG